MAESDRADPDHVARGGGDATRGAERVGAGILVSRITGLVRERAIGHFLGTSAAADAFAVAVRVPNLLQRLLGEGVLSASFIPVVSRLLDDGREDEAGKVAGAVLGLLTVVTGVLVLAGVLLAEPMTTVIAAGLRARPETFALTVSLVRLLFPGIGLLVLSAWCLGMLNSHRRFFLSYVAPAAMNVVQVAVLVGAALFVVEGTGGDAVLRSLATWLAVGTVVGGLAQLLVQVPAVRRLDLRVVPSLRTDLAGVRETLRAFAPVVTARGVVQLSTFAHVLLGSFLVAGALASLRYAQVLYALPVALFGMAVAAAQLPELSSEGVADPDAALARLEVGLRRVALLVVPTALGYLAIGDLLVGALFGSGRFSADDVALVHAVLAGYALALPASTATRLLQSALYGAREAATPARSAVVRVVVSALVGGLLMLQLDRVALGDGVTVVGDLPALSPVDASVRATDTMRLGALGLSLGGAVGAWLEYLLLYRATRTRLGGAVRLGGGAFGRILVAAVVGVAAGVGVRTLLDGLPTLVIALVVVPVVAGVHGLVATRLGVDDVQVVTDNVLARLGVRR